MRSTKSKKPFIKASGISIGLAAFLVVGLSGCDDSNQSIATKQQKCKLQEYRLQHQEECEDINRRFGNASVNANNYHSSGSSWVPMWMMMNSMNSHAGYSYGPTATTSVTSTKSGFFSSSSSSSSGSHGSSTSSGG